MLACTDGRNNKSLRQVNGDRVVFKNVPHQYKLRDKISVEYILSPKTKTSTHDYIGIYPRNWKNLREFVGFEHTITPPCEEPSLFRSIQFTCQAPHVIAVPHQDYQFIYVSQTQEVLGKSSFFQFVEDYDISVLPESACGPLEDNFTKQTLENVNIQLTPDEIAYNECYFGNQVSSFINEASRQYATDVAGLDEASNACFVPQESIFSPQESGTQTHDSEIIYKPKRGRPLVKTRDSGHLELRNTVPQSPPIHYRSYNNLIKNQCVAPERSYIPDFHRENATQTTHPNWQPSNPWHHQLRQGKWKRDYTTTTVSSIGNHDGKWGAIPKQCPKCRAPSDFSYQQQLLQHELTQAHEEIRDLKSEVEQLKHILELGEAGQAKLRVTAEIAKREARYAITFLNNLMFSLVTQYKTKIVNFDNSVMYVTRELVSPGWFVPGGASKTLVCGRPSNVKIVSGRDKELKAIIGRQEMKIQDLHGKLCLANKIIERANLLDSNVKLEFPHNERRESINSPQLTPCRDGSSPRTISCLRSLNNSTFDLAGFGEVLNNIDDNQDVISNVTYDASQEKLLPGSKLLTVDSTHSGELQKDDVASLNSSEAGKGTWEETLTVKSEIYAQDPIQFWNREVILDEEESSVYCTGEAENPIMPNETNNNNNYATSNLNSEKSVSKTKCCVCEPSVSVTNDAVSPHATETLN